jgi:diguanylate cyclase (GGDEF)-like protein
MSTAPLRTPGGEPAGVMSVALDVTERVHLAEQLRHQAFHDPLTDLANRALLQDRLEHALARVTRTGGCVAVLLLDVDAFKTVNDTHGHNVGDQLLAAIADRLRRCVPHDTVARFGGDEFVVVVEDVAGRADGVDVAEQLLHAFDTPIHMAGRNIRTRVSIGIVLAGPEARPDAVLRDADVAMCTRRRRPAVTATACSILPCALPSSTARNSRTTCATRYSATNCDCATSR